MLRPVVMETQQYCRCRWLIVGVLVCQPVSLCLLIIRDAQIADIRRCWALTHVHRGFFFLFSLEKKLLTCTALHVQKEEAGVGAVQALTTSSTSGQMCVVISAHASDPGPFRSLYQVD